MTLSPADLHLLKNLSARVWVDVDSTNGEYRDLKALGYVRYCPSIHAYCLTGKGISLLKSRKLYDDRRNQIRDSQSNRSHRASEAEKRFAKIAREQVAKEATALRCRRGIDRTEVGAATG